DRPVLDRLVGTTTVTYDPDRGVYANVGGGNVLYIPSGGVCDPTTSTYGIGQWDKPCNVLTRSIRITASSWTDSNGHPYVQFDPALRFVPSKWSVLYMGDDDASVDLTVRITYCPDTGMCIDEAKQDPSLATFHWAGGVFRRIKHFSGYNVAAGFEETPDDARASELRSASVGGVSMERAKRSGYMVVSGLEVPRDVQDRIPSRDQ